ncbi:MAG: potassium channel family protein [Spirochaetaceae bacterium]|nr:potassium channel family protein [Myxococcales bacterium]MCB9724242.1 potassium channel family protein [Spirochaetaceae bacterium]HPG25049.1 potassium channel family protein [Myxococcota bacterium]
MSKLARLRKRTFEVLEAGRRGDSLSLFVDGLVMALVLANVVVVVLESVDEVAETYEELFLGFERASVAAFTAELALRFWASAENPRHAGSAAWRRFRYVCSPMAMIDVIAIAPFYLSTFFGVDLRVLRLLRLARIVKLTRYSVALHRIVEVYRLQRNALLAAFFLMAVAVVLSASALYVVEGPVQPDRFGSIPDAMWWAVITLTTVGYGDVSPITPLGKLLAATISIVGIGMVALPTSVFASGFAHVMHRSEHLLEEEAREALTDGVMTEEEASAYEAHARALGVDPRVAQEIVTDAQRWRERHVHDACPHCGKALAD